MPTTRITQPVDVTIWEGCTGMEKLVTLPDTTGQAAVKIPPGVRDGDRITIRDGASIYLIPVRLTGDGIHALDGDGTLRREVTLTGAGIRNGGQIQVTTPYGPP